jgi:hypothetical protein
MVAEVPRALYLNFLVRKAHVAKLAPAAFTPLNLQGDDESTLFTILLFTLERARPLWVPSMIGILAPRIRQSNWRVYGHIGAAGAETRPAVLFVRTVTPSLLLSVFGRRLARCFPLRRASHMNLDIRGEAIYAAIDPGGGSAPSLRFEGALLPSVECPVIFRDEFRSYDDYARWIIDQHLSLVIWPREHVVQDMHLDFNNSRITPLRCLRSRVSAVGDFVPEDAIPFDCFLAEGLRVYLDSITSQRAI